MSASGRPDGEDRSAQPEGPAVDKAAEAALAIDARGLGRAFGGEARDDVTGPVEGGLLPDAVLHAAAVVDQHNVMRLGFLEQVEHPRISGKSADQQDRQQHEGNPRGQEQKLLDQNPALVSLLAGEQEFHRREPDPTVPEAVQQMDDDRRSKERRRAVRPGVTGVNKVVDDPVGHVELRVES